MQSLIEILRRAARRWVSACLLGIVYVVALIASGLVASLLFVARLGRAARAGVLRSGHVLGAAAVWLGRLVGAAAVWLGRLVGRCVGALGAAAVALGCAVGSATVWLALAACGVAAWLARTARMAASRIGAALLRSAMLADRLLRRSVGALGQACRRSAVLVRHGWQRAATTAALALRQARVLGGKRSRITVIVISTLVGLVAAGLNSGTLSLLPPGLKSSELQLAAAKTQVMIDAPASGLSITRQDALPQDLQSLVKRAELMGRVLVTPPVLDRSAKLAGVQRDQLSGLARLTADVPLALSEPGSERRAAEIRDTGFRYRIEVQARPLTPVLDVYAQASTPAQAELLASAAVQGLREHLQAVARVQGVPQAQLVNLRQLGPPRGGLVGGRAPLLIGVLTFLVGFGLTAAAFMLVRALERGRLAEREPRAIPDAGGNWPRTTRVLPWMVAGFIAMLWLTPFHQIELTVSTPIDLKLDRLILPFVAALWLLALSAGGNFAPRLRPTWIHVAVGAFVACAFLSVAVDAQSLARTLELDLSLKKLPLLVAYASLFLIVATSVRRSEVKSFLTFTLALGVICAAGLIFEYRFKQNLFYDYADMLLPGMFTLGGQVDGGAVDYMGRRLVRGPAEVPLEVVTMLSIALPVALVGLLRTSRWSGRIIYGLCACLLVAAMFATFRKSGLLAPVSVVLTLAYFRRGDLLKLAPLGMIVVVVVSALSPGALGSTISQFTRSDRASIPTVSDRSSDYDAVRPDVWSDLMFGRGWGSYNHIDYRILDSEILNRLIEMGVVGLIAFLLVPVAVVMSARKTIASSDREAAPLALIGAAAAVAFLVASTFYDVLSFPHATYIFLYVAGLVAVAIGPRAPESRREHARRTRQFAVRTHRTRVPPARRHAARPRAAR